MPDIYAWFYIFACDSLIVYTILWFMESCKNILELNVLNLKHENTCFFLSKFWQHVLSCAQQMFIVFTRHKPVLYSVKSPPPEDIIIFCISYYIAVCRFQRILFSFMLLSGIFFTISQQWIHLNDGQILIQVLFMPGCTSYSYYCIVLLAKINYRSQW